MDRWATILVRGEGQTLPAGAVAWSDWGQPSRVLAPFHRIGRQRAWAGHGLPPAA
jgi:hypothetical protein